MSKIIDDLKKIEKAAPSDESAGTDKRQNSQELIATWKDLRERLARKAAQEHGEAADKTNRLLEEFASIEKELLQLRKEENELLMSIRAILGGSEKV